MRFIVALVIALLLKTEFICFHHIFFHMLVTFPLQEHNANPFLKVKWLMS